MIIQTQEDMVNDEDLQKLTGLFEIMSIYQKMDAINKLTSKIKKIKESSHYIKHIRLYIPTISDMITSFNAEIISADEMKEISSASYGNGFPLIHWNNKLYLNVHFPNESVSSPASGKSLQFVMHIELSTEAIREAIGNFHKSGETVLYSDHWAIGTSPDKALFQGIRKRILPQMSAPQGSFTVSMDNGKKYVGVYEKSLILDAEVIYYLEENELLGALKSYRNWFWLLLGSSLVIVVLFSYGIYWVIHRPLRNLVKVFKSVERGDLEVSVTHKNQDEFGYLFKQFAKMLSSLKLLINETYIQKLELQKSELKQLQSQINPHFLYNSFFTLHRLIKNYEIDSAQLFSKNLGEYFQYITRDAQEEALLEAEAGHAQSFTAIQGVRFSNRIQVTFDEVPQDVKKIRVPRLILQPIIENAFEHGLRDCKKGSELIIRFELTDAILAIKVEDSGAGLNEENIDRLREKLHKNDKNEESTGIINVHRRLRLKFGHDAGVFIKRSGLGGLSVEIRIPREVESDVSTADCG